MLNADIPSIRHHWLLSLNPKQGHLVTTTTRDVVHPLRTMTRLIKVRSGTLDRFVNMIIDECLEKEWPSHGIGKDHQTDWIYFLLGE